MIRETRYGSVLKQNHSTASPAAMLFLDTETSQSVQGIRTRHNFKLGWTRYIRLTKQGNLDRESWKYWTDKKELCVYIARLTREKTSLHLYAHNAFFDLQVSGFFSYFSRHGWKLDFVYDEGLTFILCIHKEKRVIKVLSTTNYFDFSLKVLGDTLKLPKLDVTFGSASDKQLKEYCKRDVEIASESVLAFIRFCREHDAGHICMTRASQSLTAFRHRFMNHSIFIHTEPDAQKLERDGYFGGRTECGFIGKPKGGPFVFLDVNSMYPHVMRNNLYPVKLIGYSDNPTLQELINWNGKAAIMAEVSLDVRVPAYATRFANKIMFPVGKIRTVLCSGGISLALSRREIVKVHRLAIYERAPIFTKYVDYYYCLKEKYTAEGNTVYRTMVKLFLNSLYGKFGEKRWIETITEDIEAFEPSSEICIDLVTHKRWKETHMFGVKIVQEKEENGPRSFTAIAAHVTEYARLLLWSIISGLGSSKVLYCDTDSICIRESDLHLVKYPINPLALGSLSIDKRAKEFTIYGPKDYDIDGVRRTKGVPKSATKIAPNTFAYEQFLRSASHERLHETESFITEHRAKTISAVYDKGKVSRLGIVTPLHFEDF